MIDQLIQQVSAKLGIDASMAKQAVGVVLGLLQKEGDGAAVSALFSQISGASDLAGEFKGVGGGDSAMGGLMGRMGGMLGGGAGDAMSAMAAFKSTGLSIDQAKDMMPVMKDFLMENAGEDVMKQALGSVPALKGFMN